MDIILLNVQMSDVGDHIEMLKSRFPSYAIKFETVPTKGIGVVNLEIEFDRLDSEPVPDDRWLHRTARQPSDRI